MPERNCDVTNTQHGEEMELGFFFFRIEKVCVQSEQWAKSKKVSQVHSFKKTIARVGLRI